MIAKNLVKLKNLSDVKKVDFVLVSDYGVLRQERSI